MGNNMFAYCRNNVVNRKDMCGNKDEDVAQQEEDEEESFWESFLNHMARQRKEGHTFSVGYVVGALWGSAGGSNSGCISVDNSYNYALQDSSSLNAGIGTGVSGGLVFTYTSADNVQDLRGESEAYGFTLCGSLGISVDYITFTAASNPSEKCWGISVGLLAGAEVDIHAGNSYTRSKKSWNPFKALKDWIFAEK